MVSFSPILAIVAAIKSVFALPLQFSDFDHRSLPIGISVPTAKSYLSQLTVATPSNSPPYRRDYFKLWIPISGNCDTRETVLKRDGTNVVTNSNCAATSGHWVSPYDGVTITKASDLDIDHVVPLKEAWISGAHTWTDAQRQDFANDLSRPQLVAVTHKINQAKGDQDPGAWLPPLDSFKCNYAVAWIQVKQQYGLTIDSAEKAALTKTLNTYC